MEWNKLILILASMIFCHLFADYNLQVDVVSKLKCRQWWKDNAPAFLYRNDYKIVLIEHSFVWSFVMAAPLMAIAIYKNNPYLISSMLCMYVINTIMHTIIDNWKANEHKISLVEDQCFHLFQVVLTWLFAVLML